MIRFIRGKYLYYDNGAVIIETSGGIGLRVFVAEASSILSAREGDEISVYTYLQVKEDGMSLYGFPDSESLKLFEQLIAVNGVGPRAGLAIMSLGTANQIKAIIAGQDAAALSRAQGVGKKTAERVILELKDKVNVLPIDGDYTEVAQAAEALSSERSEAVTALTTLGYSKREAEDAVSHVSDEGISAEDYIRKALKYLL